MKAVPAKVSALVRGLLAIQLVRFGVVGAVVTGCFMSLNAVFARGLGWPAQVAFLAAYPPALGLHFLLNKLWTFGDRRATTSRHVGEYLFAAVLTFMIQWPAFTVLQGLGHLPGWLAAGAANLIQMTASFLLLRRRVFHADATPGSAWHRLILLLATSGTAALIIWTSLGGWELPVIGPPQHDYYNLLAAGFRKGSLALDVDLPAAGQPGSSPEASRARPPNPALHDASYYRGRYYLYFGVVPVALVFLPFHLVTGHDLPFVLGCLGFGLVGYLLAAWLWLRIVRDHFPGASLMTKLVGVVGLGTLGYQLVLARRMSLWEGPIGAGHCFAMVFLAAAYLALRSRSPGRWLAFAGLALGLAVGSRPTLIAAAPALAWLAWSVGRRRERGDGGTAALQEPGASLLAAGVPLAAVVALLGAYNYARFGNVLELGLGYQLNGQDAALMRHWSLSYLAYNFRVYFLAMPQWGRYFPFLHPIAGGTQPPGYYGIEYVYGLAVICPLIGWAAWAPREAGGLCRGGDLGLLIRMLLAMAVATTLLLLAFYAAAARYVVDFLPWWLWLACLGWAGLERRLQSKRPGWRQIALGAAFGLTAGYSAVVAFCAAAELHGLLPLEHPKAFAAISRIFDLPAAAWERWFGDPTGPLEMEITFARKNLGSVEPLVCLGVGYEKDYVYVFFTSPRVVQIGYAPSGLPGILSERLTIEPGRPYHLRVECGALYPPMGHPIYRGWTAAEVDGVKRWVRIELGGKVVLDEGGPSHEASPGTLRIGSDEAPGPYGDRFSGRLTHVVHAGIRPSSPSPAANGDILIDLTVPASGEPSNQPLIEVGRPDRADLIGLRLLGGGRMEFTYESWGLGLWISRPVTVPAGREATVRIRLGPLLDLDEQSPLRILRESIVIWSGGVPVWWRKTVRPIESHPPLVLAENTLGSSAMAAAFAGRIRRWSRGPALAAWRPGPFAAVAVVCGGRGTGVEPLLAIGSKGRGDVLAIEWLPNERARLRYLGEGAPPALSPTFPWSALQLHALKIELPALRKLDEPGAPGLVEGELAVTVDGRSVWRREVSSHPADSASVAIGLNPHHLPGVAGELSAVVVDARQVEQGGTQ